MLGASWAVGFGSGVRFEGVAASGDGFAGMHGFRADRTRTAHAGPI